MKYGNRVNQFKKKIQAIPEQVKSANNNIDFSNGRFQEIMIDLESIIEDLENEFYLHSEEVEKLIANRLI